eukprot:Gb_31491 [translate_table: standard]
MIMGKKSYPAVASGYKLLEEVGYGASATVYRAICLPMNEVVAVKCLDLDRCNGNWTQAAIFSTTVPPYPLLFLNDVRKEKKDSRQKKIEEEPENAEVVEDGIYKKNGPTVKGTPIGNDFPLTASLSEERSQNLGSGHLPPLIGFRSSVLLAIRNWHAAEGVQHSNWQSL